MKSQSQHLSDIDIKFEKKNDELKSVKVWNFNSKITLESICKKSHILTMFYYIFFLDATNCKIIHVLLFTDKF